MKITITRKWEEFVVFFVQGRESWVVSQTCLTYARIVLALVGGDPGGGDYGWAKETAPPEKFGKAQRKSMW